MADPKLVNSTESVIFLSVDAPEAGAFIRDLIAAEPVPPGVIISGIITPAADIELIDPKTGVAIDIAAGAAKAISSSGIVDLILKSEATANAAEGSITIAVGNAEDGNTVTVDDGIVEDALIFEFNTERVAATGTITLSDLPSDGDTITFDTVVFEFDSNEAVTEGNISVVIGVDVAATLTVLQAAINTSALEITSGNPDVDHIDLTADVAGLVGNVEITKSGANITVDGMSGGLGEIPAAPNIEVVIGGSNELSATALKAAIDTSGLDITVAVDAGVLSLTNNNDGVAGNVALAKSGDNITVDGMAGGADANLIATTLELYVQPNNVSG